MESLPAAPAPEHFGGLDLVRESIAHTQRRVLGIARRLPGTVVGTAFNAVRHPLNTANEFAHTAASIGRALAPAADPHALRTSVGPSNPRSTFCNRSRTAHSTIHQTGQPCARARATRSSKHAMPSMH